MRLVIGNKNYSSWFRRPWLVLKHARLRIHTRAVALPSRLASYRDQVLADHWMRQWYRDAAHDVEIIDAAEVEPGTTC